MVRMATRFLLVIAIFIIGLTTFHLLSYPKNSASIITHFSEVSNGVPDYYFLTISYVLEYIKPLLDYVISYIPENKREYTPVFLLATAGMRLVPEKLVLFQNYIYHKCFLLLLCSIMKEHIRVIEGKWEALTLLLNMCNSFEINHYNLL
uniref:Mannosyltransferase n=1 Tax=Heterorhabditis bacteriophora TaxID=37862 RepID=A0A1I7WVE0_HETBA